MLESIRKTNPNLFYSKFANKKANKVNVSLENFHEHFKSLATDENLNHEHSLVNEDDVIFEELEEEISLEDIENAIKILKTGKSHGKDYIINEYFIVFKDILLPFVNIMFNAMFSKLDFSLIFYAYRLLYL